MKKLHLKSLAIGFIAGLLTLSTVFAATTLRKAEFNTTKIFYNDTQIDLTSQPMINVYKDEEIDPRNYMPVRAILEAMNFGVAWDGDVWVFSKEYLDAAQAWVKFTDLQAITELDRRVNRFEYISERKTVHAYWDARYHWDIPTAVVGQEIYVQKEAVDHMLDLCVRMNFDDYTPELLEQIRTERSRFVSAEEIFAALQKQEGLIYDDYGASNKLQIIYYQDEDVFKVYYDRQLKGTIQHVLYEYDTARLYALKTDVNYYMDMYGLTAL